MNLLGRLSRVTSSYRTYIPQIDGLRFLAIMWVIAYHVRAICLFHLGASQTSPTAAGGILNDVFDAGAYSVELFFAISGFVLALPFAKQHLGKGPAITLRGYYIRRLTRLEPPYVIHLLFLFVLCWAVLRRLPSHFLLYRNEGWTHEASAHLLASLFYSHGFIFGAHPYPNIVLWSLEVEVQFYIVAPVLSLLFAISHAGLRRALLVGLIVISSGVSFWLARTNQLTYAVGGSLLGNLHFFLIGFLFCDFYLGQEAFAGRRTLKWDFLFLAASATFIFLHRYSFAVSVLYPWLILICCTAAFNGTVCARLLSNPWVTTIGGMCYTIYMYHYVMISALFRATDKLATHQLWLDLLIQFAVMAPAIVIMCGLLFVCFERPFMQRGWHVRLRDKVWKSRARIRPAIVE
jgi:peptidoglycan/LPS O-acetylase OafA/YrhL